MPELAEKTPAYDVYVYMNGSKEVVIPVSRVTYEQAKKVRDSFSLYLPGHYGTSASVEVGDYMFNKMNVDYVKIVRHRVKILSEAGRWVAPWWKETFIEDDPEQENDCA